MTAWRWAALAGGLYLVTTTRPASPAFIFGSIGIFWGAIAALNEVER